MAHNTTIRIQLLLLVALSCTSCSDNSKNNFSSCVCNTQDRIMLIQRKHSQRTSVQRTSLQRKSLQRNSITTKSNYNESHHNERHYNEMPSQRKISKHQ